MVPKRRDAGRPEPMLEQSEPLRPGLFEAAHACLVCTGIDAKIELTARTAEAILDGWIGAEPATNAPAVERIVTPGRPLRPELVAPRDLVRRRLGTLAGRVALVHAVAHIEFNAINLAWDAVYRFRDMPAPYYLDWTRVAADEARHFAMLRRRLVELGHDYGDFPAHNGLWEMALATDHDCLERMALVPRVLEARGLDVTPGMIERLRAAGDSITVEALELILREEVDHVAAGTRWFRYLCEQRGIDPDSHFETLLDRHCRSRIRGPFNEEARLLAGFAAGEMRMLERMDGGVVDA